MLRTSLLAVLAGAFASRSYALDTWYTPPGGPPVGIGFNATDNTSASKIKGTNLGGWLITENWMTPSLYGSAGLPGKNDDKSAMDEWTLCETLGDGCEAVLENHWATFYSEEDFIRMANYGLNTVRIPVPYWIWNKTDDEPFITGSQIPYLQRALNWSYIYGLDVILDMHALPGSQSSYQVHTGLYAQEGFQNSTTNMDRAIDAITKMTTEFTKEEYNGVITAIELVNEPWIEAYQAGNMPWTLLEEYMVKAYNAVRAAETIIDDNEEVMVIVHDAFGSLTDWTSNFFAENGDGYNWTNYAVDTHIYHAWSDIPTELGHIQAACDLVDYLETAQASVPIIVGEFSLGVQTFCVNYKDCFNLTLDDALANVTTTGEYGSRDMFVRTLWEAQLYVYEHTTGWIFWNWKTELAPTWSYEQSVAQGWIPVDLTDRIWSYDRSNLTSCLVNKNESNIPDFVTSSAGVIEDGTATTVNSPISLLDAAASTGSQSLTTAGTYTSTSATTGSQTLTGSQTTATAAATSATGSATRSFMNNKALILTISAIVASLFC